MNPIQSFEYQEFRRSFSPRRITISPYRLPLQPTPHLELEPEWELPKEWYTWNHRNNLFNTATRLSPYIKKLGFHRTWTCMRPILEDVANAWLVWLERETWPLINLDRWERLADYMNNYWPNVRNSTHIWYPLLEYMDRPEGMPTEDYAELMNMTIQAELELEGGIGNQLATLFVLVFTEMIKGFNNYFNRQLNMEEADVAADNLAWTITAASIIIANLTPSVVRTPFRSPYVETWETTSAWRYITNWWNTCLSKYAFRE